MESAQGDSFAPTEARSRVPASGFGVTAAPFGKFVLVERLGIGGMGEVWKAWDGTLQRWVALKLIRTQDPTDAAYFAREAQMAAGLDHPNIAKVYEVGDVGGAPFIAMQLIEGADLRARAAKATLDQRVAWVRDMAAAVRYAHEKGVIHRDLKPGNAMVDEAGRVYVLDFGLAKRAGVDGRSIGGSGIVVGTPAYMAPEQARGRADPQSDVYALGATLYDLVTGRPPFSGETAADILVSVVSADPVVPRKLNPSLPADLEAIVLKAMEREKGRRYAYASHLLEDLDAYLARRPLARARPRTMRYIVAKSIRRQPVLWSLAAAVVVATAVGLTFGVVTLVQRNRALAETARVERVERERAEHAADEARAAQRVARVAEWNATLELSHSLYERAQGLRAVGRVQAAAACLLRALEVAPLNLRPAGYATTDDQPGWAREAWDMYRFLDPDLGRVCARLEGHTERARSVAVSPDGRYVASRGLDRDVRLWDVERATTVLVLKERTNGDVAWSPDGRLVAAGAGLTVGAWEAATGRLVARFAGHTDAMVVVRFSPAGSIAASAGGDGRVRVWEVATGVERHSLAVSGPLVRGLAFNTDGSLLVATGGTTVAVWRTDTGESRRSWTLPGHASDLPRVNCVEFADDGRTVILGCDDGTLRRWDWEAGIERQRWKAHEGAVSQIERCGEGLVSVGHDNFIRVWDTMRETAVVSIEGHELARDLCADRDGRRVFATWANAIVAWNVVPRVRCVRLAAVEAGLLTASMSEGGARALVCTYSGEAYLFDAVEGGLLRALPDHGAKVSSAWLSADGRRGVTGDAAGCVRVWDLDRGIELGRYETGAGRVQAAQLTRDGALVVTVAADDRVRAYDAASGTLRYEQAKSPGKLASLRVLPDAPCVIQSSSRNATLVVHDLAARTETPVALPHREIIAFEVSRDGSQLLCIDQDGGGHLYDTGSWTKIRTHVDLIQVGRLAWSPDGRWLLSTVRQTQISLRDARSGAVVLSPGGGDTNILALAFSEDGLSARAVLREGSVLSCTLLRAETPAEPPAVDPGDATDPYRAFEPFYARVGMRVVRDGPNKGRIEVIR